MEYATFKGWVRRTGLDMKGFANILGMNQRSISNYSVRGKVPRLLALVALMMVELDRRSVDINELIAKLGEPEKQNDKRREGGFKGRKSSAKKPDAS